MKIEKICSLFIFYQLFLLMPCFLYAQSIEITTGSSITVTGAAIIEIYNGNFINNGTYTKGNETITFSGTVAKTISGSSNTDLYNLTATNTGGISTQLGLLSTNHLTIASGSKFTIEPAKAVTVNGTLSNNAENTGFVIKSDATGTASLLHNTNSVPATVQRYISGTAEAWHFLSSPVAAQGIGDTWLPAGTYGNGTGYDLYLWNEPNNCWIYKLDITSAIKWSTVHPGANFVPGRGYLYSVQATNPTKEFAGNLNNGSLSYILTISSTDLNLKGFNLVGNPYPSSIDWAATSGWTRSNLVNSGGGYDMWIWNPTANNYGVFNSFTGVGTNSVTRYIASMQGYFVQAASAGNLSLDNGVRIHNEASNWKNATIHPELFSIVVQSATDNSFDESLLLFGYAANQTGAAKLFSQVATAPSIYLPIAEANYSVRYLTDTVDNPTVPVMFKAGRDGNYTLNCTFDKDQFEIVLLEDRQRNDFHNLKIESTYSFTASKADNNNRFVLHFRPVKNQPDIELPGKIYADVSNLIIDLVSVPEETEVLVYDVLGRIILQQKLSGGTRHTLNVKADTQLIIVCLKNPSGSLNRKILWGRK